MGFFSKINEDSFRLPDMGEYYDQDLVEELLESMDSENPQNAAYYIEEPFKMQPGFYPDFEAFVLKGIPQIAKNDSGANKIGLKNEELNIIDGDTIIFSLDSIDSGDNPFTIKGNKFKSFKDYAYSVMSYNDFKSNALKIRTIAVNAPEIAHYTLVPYKKSELSIIKKTIKAAKSETIEVIYDKTNYRADNEVVNFVYTDNRKTKLAEVIQEYSEYPYSRSSNEDKFHEINFDHKISPVSTEKGEDTVWIKIVSSDEREDKKSKHDNDFGLEAKAIMINLLNRAEDLRIVVDAKQLQYKPGFAEGVYSEYGYGWSDLSNLMEYIKLTWHRAFGDNVFLYKGFNAFGQDSYRRFLGAIYVKVKIEGSEIATWVNVAKYLMYKLKDHMKLMIGNTPSSIENGSSLSKAFKIWSYDMNNIEYADGFFDMSKSDFDDRRAIQKEITGYDFDVLREHTVMIGDCLFVVPPTSIRVVNQIESQRVPLLRSKGSITKELPHNDRIIEMTLYFNTDQGINGIKKNKKLPNGSEVAYYMNGLRTLIAMFSTTPFLPIENAYINDVLNIEAVALANLQIQTMPSYPKCIAATLTLQQFNYRVFLNELPTPNPENGESYKKNMFASTINYGVMRYYYQRAIQRGEELKALDPLSDEYIHKTMGSRTNLVPMEFKDQTIKFYKLDNNWLDDMKTTKEAASKRPINQVAEINDTTVTWATQVGISLAVLLKEFDGLKFNSPLLGVVEEEGKLLNILNKVKENKSCPLLMNMEFGTKKVNGKRVNTIEIKFDVNSLTTHELDNLMRAVYKELDLQSETNPILSNGIIELPLKESGGDEKIFIVDSESNAYNIAEFFAFRSGYINGEVIEGVTNGNWKDFAVIHNENILEDLKDNAVDRETLLSAKFVRYPMEDVIAQNFSVSMGNSLANTKLKVQDGYAPQYAGGKDIVVEFMFHTRNQDTVTALNALNQIAAQDLVKYRSVIECWPIRIDSELTRLCGINEVIIESVDISTVQKQPGLFAIHCRALSLDRTMRNREILNRLDKINNSGATNPDGIENVIYRTYFDLNTVLSQAEVYPDLELPTLQELDETGYKFIRYMQNREQRTYPDPDFYFVYGYVYTSQMIRKTITDFFDAKGKEAEMINMVNTFTDDKTGQTVDTKYDKENTLSFECKNQELEKNFNNIHNDMYETIDSVKEGALKDQKEREEKINRLKDGYEKLTSMENDILINAENHWNVCQNIKCSLGDIRSKYESGSQMRSELEKKSDELINLIDEYLKNPIVLDSSWDKIDERDITHKKRLEKTIKSFVKKELEDGGIWSKVLEIAGCKTIPEKSKKTIRGIFSAAAMALSGETEYSTNIEESSYAPRAVTRQRRSEQAFNDQVIPYCIISDNDTGEIFTANSLEQAVSLGISFGAYQIRKYNSDFLRDFYGTHKTFNDYDFLDPYYNSTIHNEMFNKHLSSDEKTKYAENILKYSMFSLYAFSRNCLVWLKKLVEDGLFISFFDLARHTYLEEYKKIAQSINSTLGSGAEKEMNNGSVGNLTGYGYRVSIEEDRMKVASPIAGLERDVVELLTSYENEIASGKVFMPVLMAVISGDSSIYRKMINRDVGALNVKTQSCEQVLDITIDVSQGERNFRKFIRGMCATNPKVMTSITDIAGESNSKLNSSMQDRIEKLWVEAANDPTLWLAHSYYDMVVNNKRGRMARAFPTYYMMLVDEGREIGYWKLHDNFYNMSSIVELEVVKSRKIPADTAKIVLTNMFKTYTTDDEDIKTDYQSNARDIFTSIFNPHAQFEKEELRRMQQMNINKIKLVPGARVHLRMGYSGDASNLPIVFNGRIAEVGSGEVVEILAQGDAHELINPNAFAGVTAVDLSDLKNEKIMPGVRWFVNMLTEGATPKELINNILTTKGGFTKNIINWVSDGRFYNDNMFGIVNFGEIDYKTIHKNGEVMQNIYEAEGYMPWTKTPKPGSVAELHSAPEPPRFTVELKDKSAWDIFNICAGTSLNFMTSIAPFGVRSTIFFGRPHYYYAYDYAIDSRGRILEKRKPYQQYHIIDSYSDIISNCILASGKDIKTCAVPIYEGPNAFNKIVEKRLPSPLWVDFDIYPEYQKTTVVKTGLVYKANKLGAILYNKFKDEWDDNGGQKIAWRMGAKALKDSIKDMYRGEVIIIGDPVIKPYDRVYLHDVYENMNGSVEVEAVVNRISSETGFTTSVYVDCISSVDDRYEQMGQMWNTNIALQVLFAKGTLFAGSKLFDTTTKPMLNFIANSVAKGVSSSAKAINSAMNLIGQEEIINFGKIEGWNDDFFKSVGISKTDINIWSKINSMRNWKDILGYDDIKSIESIDELYSILNKSISTIDKTNPSEMAKALEKMLNDKKGNISTGLAEELDDIIKDLRLYGKRLEGSLEKTMKTVGINVLDKIKNVGSLTDDEIKLVNDLMALTQKTGFNTKDAKAMNKIFKQLSSKMPDLIDNADLLVMVGKHIDDVKDVMKVASATSKSNKIAKLMKTGVAFLAGGPIASILLIVGEMLLEYVLVKNVYNWIEMKMASFNVLQIYPLKKNGIAYVAGIDGHKGLVVGSPTYEQNGIVDTFINWVFKDRGPFYNIFKGAFFSENMNNIANTYRKTNQVGEYIGDTGRAETEIEEMMRTIAENQASNFSAYRAMLIPKRISDLGSVNAKYTYNKSRVMYNDEFETNSIILNELVPITIDNESLRPYFERNEIKTLHVGNISGDNSVERFTAKFNTKSFGEINVKCMDISSKNRKIIDIPFLRPDAFQILYRILEEITFKKTEVGYGDSSNNTLYFKSGTTVGDNQWSATGYAFTIQVASIKSMEDIFNKMYDEFKDMYSKGDNRYQIFQYKKLSDGKSYSIFVSPRDEYIKFEDLKVNENE